MSTKDKKKYQGAIGDVITELLEELSRTIEWSKFKHFYTLLMLLLQHIIEVNH